MSLTEGQLERRKSGLGGSDVSAILGVNPYETPLTCWMQKTGKAPKRKETGGIHWGVLLEPVIAQHFADQNNVSILELHEEDTPVAHADRAWHLGTPDRLILPPAYSCKAVTPMRDWIETASVVLSKCSAGLEIKTAGLRVAHRWGETGTDQIPREYIIQCSWYASLFGLSIWEVAALIGGQDYREYTIELDQRLESFMLEKAERFWFDNVQADVPPDAMRGSDRKAIGHLIKEHKGCYTQARGNTRARALEAFNLQRKAKESQDEYETAVAKLGESMVLTPGVEMDEGKAKWIHPKGKTPYLRLFPRK